MWGMKTHCVHGHEYTEDNTRWVAQVKGPYTWKYRECRECLRARGRSRMRQRYWADPDQARSQNRETQRLRRLRNGIVPRHVKKGEFWERVEKTGGCWLWTGSRNGGGYGNYGGKGAHRYAYELLKAPIPPGLVIDHLCRVRHCVNPDHMEPVTQSVNCRRGDTGKR
jgi:hypothetical protein